jgi:hypothetical protein
MSLVTGLGNTKSFRVPDPRDDSRYIQYTSVQGPEAAIYTRGTAELIAGQAFIEFPDHFAAMAAEGTITVSVTPMAAGGCIPNPVNSGLDPTTGWAYDLEAR